MEEREDELFSRDRKPKKKKKKKKEEEEKRQYGWQMIMTHNEEEANRQERSFKSSLKQSKMDVAKAAELLSIGRERTLTRL